MYKHLHYKNMKYKPIIVVLTTVMVLSLTACGKSPAPDKSELSVSTDTQVESPKEENYGVAPDHYEDLGDGIYQVYVKIDGKIIPYVTVDSATGDYHG